MRMMYDNNPCEKVLPGASIDCINDLQLNKLATLLKYKRNSVLTGLDLMKYYSSDEKTIAYRQAVFEDLYEVDLLYQLFDQVYPSFERLNELRNEGRSNTKHDPMSLKKEIAWLELYVDLMTDLYEGYMTVKSKITSKGMISFFERIELIYQSDEFKNIVNNYERLLPYSKDPKSIILGINLDEMLRPISFYCIDLKDDYFLPAQVNPLSFKSKTKKKRGIGTFLYQSEMHTNTQSTLANTQKLQRMTMLKKDNHFITTLDSFSKKLTMPYQKSAKYYVKDKTSFLVEMIDDLAFLLGSVTYIKMLQEKKMPVAKPTILPLVEKQFEVKGIYNPFLVVEEDDYTNKIVLNDLHFDQNGTALLLVGANKGGKTTLIQAIGLTLVLAHLGCYVPCKTATVSLCDYIFTHYQKEEDYQTREGRLGFESILFKKIFDVVTENSFVLINEPFTTTSPKEGEYLAHEVLKALKEIGVNSILVTHFYHLTERLEKINSESKRKSKARCLSMGIADGKDKAIRTYQLTDQFNQSSYSIDIVKQYGENLFE